jgi:hypothetical protein
MGLRIDIQQKLIDLFKVDTYEIVDYDTDGNPSLTGNKETPKVECNEISCIVTSQPGKGYVFRGWLFEVFLDFKHEIDYSDMLLGLDNLSYSYNDEVLVEVTMDDNISVKHPPRNLSHNGTQMNIKFNINLKK